MKEWGKEEEKERKKKTPNGRLSCNADRSNEKDKILRSDRCSCRVGKDQGRSTSDVIRVLLY